MKKTIEFDPSMGGKLESISMGEDGKIDLATALEKMDAMAYSLRKIQHDIEWDKSDYCFPLKKPTRVKAIVNGLATILFINGKKCVAKCHDEEFNVTKGVLVCISKYLGVTHSRIKSILKTRGLANSQDAELCLLWDIADRGGFDSDVIKTIEAQIEKNSNNLD